MLMAPFFILIFLPICAMSGMAGRRWKAFGLYLIGLVVALVLQGQQWYQPFARMFPRPEWLREQLRFVVIPPLDLLMWLALAVIAIYLALRDRSVPIGATLTLPPAGHSPVPQWIALPSEPLVAVTALPSAPVRATIARRLHEIRKQCRIHH